MDNPMSRRLGNKPEALIDKAMEILNDPKLKISYEDRLAMFEPLARAKHLGKAKKEIPPGQNNTGGMNG